ncbi:MAG: glycerol-3-phosphate 1-O-acyltransferase PlsY [Verrucomicrobiota bacterium]
MSYLILPLAFLIGSIPFGLILGKQLKGIDIREHGSGNIGTTNVFRVLGKGPGILCLILDILKGYLPVLLAMNLVQFGDNHPWPDLAFLESLRTTLSSEKQTFVQTLHILAALLAVLGHNYSPWLGFKGGKGIATTLGVLLALMPAGALILLLIFSAVTFTSKYVSLGSITAAIALPLLTLWGSYHHGKLQDGTWNKPLFIFALLGGIMAVWKHRSNIQRLLNGTENKIGSKKKTQTQ